jgi:hypothetical protein
MTSRAALVVFVVVVSVACGKNGSPSPTGPSPSATISAVARGYLEEVVAVMQRSSIKRLTIDWNTFRTRVLSDASTAQTIGDTYPAIRTALTLLGDGHSSFRTAAGTTIFVPTRSCSGSQVAAPTLPDTIGYVYVGTFGSGDAAIERASQIQSAIRSADRETTTSWIVDLRSNGGGNMWPMSPDWVQFSGREFSDTSSIRLASKRGGSIAMAPRGPVRAPSSACRARIDCGGNGRG